MISEPSVLAVIAARGGSKGIPRKNILQLGGKPLITWTIEAALKAKSITRLILSSDDDEIIQTANAAGCEAPYKRPTALATDKATSADVIRHALTEVPGYQYVMLLQPTSPFRTASDIDEAFKLVNKFDAPSCVSLCPVEESPYWMYELGQNGKISSLINMPVGILRRQDLPPVYKLNGAIYISRVNWFLKTNSFLTQETIGYVMPRERSLDIDTDEDLHLFARNVERYK